MVAFVSNGSISAVTRVPSTVSCGSTGLRIPGVINQGIVQHTPMFLPSPSGLTYTIAFTEASGSVWALTVDQAYTVVMQQISMHHQSKYKGGQYQLQQSAILQQSPISSKLELSHILEGDFSEEEMELDKEIIKELKSG